MLECYWIVTYEEKLHKGKPVLEEDGKPKVDSITIGPFYEEQKARDYSDKNVKIRYKLFKCGERMRDKATKKIREGQAEEV